MRPMMHQDIRALARNDAKRVKKQAAYVITITKDGVHVRKNKNPILRVIAIIGPGTIISASFKTRDGYYLPKSTLGEKFSECVLSEIGIADARPYARARNNNGSARRRKWFFLDERQYALVAPIVFKLIQEIADRKVSRRKNGHQYELPISRYNLRFKQGVIQQREGKRHFGRGCRFSTYKGDGFIHDIYWAALRAHHLQRHLRGLAKYIHRFLNAQYGSRGYRISISKLKGFLEIKLQLQSKVERKPRASLAKYHLVELLKFLPKKTFYTELTEIVSEITGWEGVDFKEQMLAHSGATNKEARIGSMQLEITSDVQELKKGKDLTVFEVFSSNVQQAEYMTLEPAI